MIATFQVEPTPGRIDDPITFRLSGLHTGNQVVIRAEARAGMGGKWRSWAEFNCGAGGVIDPAQDSPIDGSYVGAEPMGLFWSMQAPQHVKRSDFLGRSLDPIEVKLTAELSGKVIASVFFSRAVAGPGIRRVPIRSEGFVGTLFHPEGNRHPGVIVLGGSEGGLIESFAAALANRGYAALALAYFGTEGLPKNLRLIPLEYFGRAVNWMTRHPAVAGGRVTAIGASKGGELALLLGSIYPEIGAVVAVVPSGVAFYGLGVNPLSVFKSSWSLQGKPVPYVPMRFNTSVVRAMISRSPLEIRAFYDPALENTTAVGRAEINVERIRGPVLLISAEDDRMWPSTRLAQIAADRLDSSRHPFPYQHIRYQDCGHAVSLPGLPSINSVKKAFMGRDLRLGGTPGGNAKASANAWSLIREFLAEQSVRHVTN